ncbi:MAG TPA: hypothetical protein VHL53_06620 [Acidimicrobiia bacterium]|nr:hypothetical protein [Acidimicrobiia bacterium]
MKGKLAVLAAAAMCVAAAGVVPAHADANSYGPGTYKAGPHNADPSAYESADPATGKVTIFQHNTRQAAAVNCVGDGPRATLLATHAVPEGVSGDAVPGQVVVDYTDAMLSDHEIILDVLVTGDKTGFLGHKADFGPKMNESGSLAVPLKYRPVAGEVMTVQFGLQAGAGCLPHPLIGLDGSRFVNGGQATFTDVKVG